MNRTEFGQLVAALRQDLNWTQSQLSEAADVDEPVISQIERGVKKHFEPDLLFRLANTLQLTTLERREFILAASGLEERQIVRQSSAGMRTDVFNSGLVLERMLELTASIKQPAFLCDVYSDVIAANKTMLAFYRVPPEMLETAATMPGGYNATRVNFGRDLVSRTQVTDNWDNYALNSMRSFRVNSLRYRAQPYFKYLMKHFRNSQEYPLFDRFWKLVSSTEQDKETNVDQFKYHHNEFGPMNYLAVGITAITSFGELILTHNVPLDDHTDQVFMQLKAAAGEGVLRIAPWPEKPMV